MRLTQYPPGSRKPQQSRREIGGLTLFLLFLLLIPSLCPAFSGTIDSDSSFEKPSFFVTTEEFCSFLNEAAVADFPPLYEGSNHSIIRSGKPGNYLYEVVQGKKKEPLSFLNSQDVSYYLFWKETSRQYPISNNTFFFTSLKHQEKDLLSIDPLLRSNEIGVHVASPCIVEEASPLQEDFSWDSLRVSFSALITIGTLFAEGHFSLEKARRNTPSPPIDHSTNPRIESRCYSSAAVLESLKAHDPVVRLQAEQQRLNKHGRSNSYLEEALKLETEFHDTSQRTFLGQMDEARNHLTQGIGHFLKWGLYALSPVLDNGRRITAGGVIGYSVGAIIAYVTRGSFFALLSDGHIGAYIGALAFGFNDIYEGYNNWGNYQNARQDYYEKMNQSFSAASTSFWKAWSLQEAKRTTKEKRRLFYQQQLITYLSTHEFYPEHPLLLLEAQAHQVMEATEQEKQQALADFLTMGETFYGPEIMSYAFPEAKREVALKNFDEEKDHLLAALRCASISILRQWQKENLQKGLTSFEEELSKQAEKVITSSAKQKEQEFHQFMDLGDSFYGPEIMEAFFPRETRPTLLAHFSTEKEGILKKLKKIQTPLSPWQKECEGSSEELRKRKEELQQLAATILSKVSTEEKKAAMIQFVKSAQKFYGLDIAEFFFPGILDFSSDDNQAKALAIFDQEREQVLNNLHCLYLSRLRQQQYLLRNSKKTPGMMEDELPSLAPLTRFHFLMNHTLELRDYASNELEKLKIEAQKNSLKKILTTSFSLSYHTITLGLKVIATSTFGFIIGSFIGSELPISFASGDLYHPWVEANNAGFAYAAYFAIVGSMSQNTIRKSAQNMAAAYAQVNEIWNNSYKQQAAQKKLEHADTIYRQALENYESRHAKEKGENDSLPIGSCNASLISDTDGFLYVDTTVRAPHLRSSYMPRTRQKASEKEN